MYYHKRFYTFLSQNILSISICKSSINSILSMEILLSVHVYLCISNDISLVLKKSSYNKKWLSCVGKNRRQHFVCSIFTSFKKLQKLYPTLICCDNDHTHLCMTINSIVWAKQVSAKTTQIVLYRNGRI